MKNDIPLRPVEGVSVAIAPDDSALPIAGADAVAPWSAWLLNANDYPITTVLIVSEGYGQHDGHAVSTSRLRYFFEEIGPRAAVRIEPLDPGIFHLTQEFWVSYYHDGQLLDKKYVFVPGTLEEANFTAIGLLDGRTGVLHS